MMMEQQLERWHVLSNEVQDCDDSPDAVKDDEDQLKTMNDTFSDDNKQLMHVQTL